MKKNSRFHRKSRSYVLDGSFSEKESQERGREESTGGREEVGGSEKVPHRESGRIERWLFHRSGAPPSTPGSSTRWWSVLYRRLVTLFRHRLCIPPQSKKNIRKEYLLATVTTRLMNSLSLSLSFSREGSLCQHSPEANRLPSFRPPFDDGALIFDLDCVSAKYIKRIDRTKIFPLLLAIVAKRKKHVRIIYIVCCKSVKTVAAEEN